MPNVATRPTIVTASSTSGVSTDVASALGQVLDDARDRFVGRAIGGDGRSSLSRIAR